MPPLRSVRNAGAWAHRSDFGRAEDRTPGPRHLRGIVEALAVVAVQRLAEEGGQPVADLGVERLHFQQRKGAEKRGPSLFWK